MKKFLIKFFKNEESASPGEHILLSGLVMIAVVLSYNNLSSNLNLALNKVSNAVNPTSSSTSSTSSSTTTAMATSSTTSSTTTAMATSSTTSSTTTAMATSSTTSSTTTAMATSSTTSSTTTAMATSSTTSSTTTAMATSSTTSSTTTAMATSSTSTTTTAMATSTTTTAMATSTTTTAMATSTTTTAMATSTTTTAMAMCLPPDILIRTVTAEKKISNLKVGDIVLSDNGKPVRIAKITKVEAKNHKVMKIKFNDGTSFEGSAEHPTADGRLFKDLKTGDKIDGRTVVETKLIPYKYSHTYDILPDSKTGNYYANGVLIGSTLKMEEVAVTTMPVKP